MQCFPPSTSPFSCRYKAISVPSSWYHCHRCTRINSRDRYYIFALSKQPGERQLSSSTTLFLSDFFQQMYELEILWEIFFAVSRCMYPEVALFKVIWRLQLASEESSPKRAVGNHCNSQLAASLQQPN